MNNRIEAIQKRLQNEGIDYLLISDPASINYLLGKMIHPGERMLVLCLGAKGNHQFFLNRLFNVPEEFGIEKTWFFDTDNYLGMLSDYIKDIIGLSVYEGEKFIGEITDWIETGSNNVYVIKRPKGKDVLIPAIDSVVLNIDIENKRMSVNMMEGLMEDED